MLTDRQPENNSYLNRNCWSKMGEFLVRLHFSAEELLLYPRRRRPCRRRRPRRRPQNVRANVKVLEF